MFVKTKTWNGQVYEEGVLNLYPHDNNSNIGKGKLELGGKVYWVQVVRCGGETKNGKPKWGFLTMKLAPKGTDQKKKW